MIDEFEYNEDDFELVTEDALDNAEEADLLIQNELPDNTGYYVLFHKASGNIVAIDRYPANQPDSDFLELFLNESKELDALFSNRLNIEKIKVRYDIARKSYILVVDKDFGRLFAHEFILVDISTVDNYIIDIKFNIVNKNVYFKLNYKKLAFYLSTQTPEYVLELSNNDIVYYLFDKNDPTLLFDRYDISLKDLIDKECITFKADWLDRMRTSEFRLLTSNVGVEANIVVDDQYVKDHLDYETIETENYPETPSLKLRIVNDLMVLESMIVDPVNYKLNEEISLYVHREGEPEALLRTYVINRNDLANYNKFVLDVIEETMINERLSVICNPRYLNVETIYE